MASLLCRVFGHEWVFRLYDMFSYTMLLACSAAPERTPHGKVVCARCGVDQPEVAARG